MNEAKEVKTAFPNGHFYSPVVDPSTVGDYLERRWKDKIDDLKGIGIDLEGMRGFWTDNLDFIKSCTFPQVQTDTHRYYFNCGFYGPGDGTILRTMIRVHRPRRIIEIGSGFSTACALDTIDELQLRKSIQITCIEPYPERLEKLLRASDRDVVSVLRQAVQAVDLSLFSELQANDILFIDSTHVLKTGSDVHFELFYILPCLKPGVLIHFHDIHFPFEYPRQWIYDRNFSWNEVYALRAFLSYNNSFRILFYNDLFARAERTLVEQTYPYFLINPGGALWMTRLG